eukprot:3100907-Karenia_brevis.AAC.1
MFSHEHPCCILTSPPLSKADDDIAICCSAGSPSSIRDRDDVSYCRPGYMEGNNRNACELTTR